MMRFAYFYKTGEVAEWLKALVSKTNMGVSPSGVRIPPSPPIFTFCEITRQRARLNSLKNIVN